MLDIEQNRRAQKYSAREQWLRVAWALLQPLFRASPRPLFGWRRGLLRLMGARIGRQVHVYPSATIYFPWNLSIEDFASIGEWALVYNLGPVHIGRRATISHKAHLCAGTHDYADPSLPLLKPPIRIGADAWICAEAFVAGGVTVGDGAVVGARAVAVGDVPPWTVVAGNPAVALKQRTLRPGSGAHG